MKKQRLFLCCFIFLASCSPAEAEIPTTTPYTPTSTIITPSRTNSPTPTETATVTNTPEPLPTTTKSPTATEEAGLRLSDIEGQATPEQIVELIRNGETLIPADALTDEFLDAYLQAMNYEYLSGEPVKEITVEQFEALKTNLGYMEYSQANTHLFLAVLQNAYAFSKDIQIFNNPDLSHLKAIGLSRVSWQDPKTKEIKTAMCLVTTQNSEYVYNGETIDLVSIAGFSSFKENEKLDDTQTSLAINTPIQQMGINEGDIIMFGVNPNGNNDQDSPVVYRYFNDPILKAMYPEWETQALQALIEGDTNLVPIIPLADLLKVSPTKSIFK